MRDLAWLLASPGHEIHVVDLVTRDAPAGRRASARELGSAEGLGGRAADRGPVERARKTVGARIRHALARIRGADPELGRHRDRALVLGVFCRYEPAEPVEWTVTTGVSSRPSP